MFVVEFCWGLVLLGKLCSLGFGVNVYFFQDAFPCRVKAMHFVYEPAVFSIVFALVKPFLKEKLVSRVS